jgi:type II secretory ATPase GspE/PulE/Tfp pilus assembly ATPase PilB-like protein
VLLDIFPDGVKVRNEVDGIVGPARAFKPAPKTLTGKAKEPDAWEDATPFQAEAGKELVAAIRALAAVEVAEAAEKTPSFDLELAGKKRPCKLGMKTLATSRQLALALDEPPLAVKKIEDLGMPGDMANKVRGLLTLEKGIFIVSSPPLSGATTTFDAILASTDRLLRDFVSIESGDKPPAEIQNIKPVRFSAATGETPMTALKKALLEYPKAVVTRDLTDAETAAKLVELADDQTLVIVSIRAGDAIDAIHRLLALKVDREKLGRSLIGSLAQRLVRKLCPQCAEGLPPPAELLQRLKISAEELPEIKKASSHGGCRACYGRRYVGRTGLFELASGPALRQQLAAESDPKLLRQAAVKDGMRPLRDEGFSTVVAAKTSLEEVQRVFAPPPKKEAGPAGVRK